MRHPVTIVLGAFIGLVVLAAAPPTGPRELAGQSGSAIVQFVVDTSGRAKRESITCTQADGDAGGGAVTDRRRRPYQV